MINETDRQTNNDRETDIQRKRKRNSSRKRNEATIRQEKATIKTRSNPGHGDALFPKRCRQEGSKVFYRRSRLRTRSVGGGASVTGKKR